jgi:hypothetical protein
MLAQGDQMTTLQARSWAHFAQRVTKARDYSRIWAIARTALGIVVLVALLAAAFAVRVYMYLPVH